MASQLKPLTRAGKMIIANDCVSLITVNSGSKRNKSDIIVLSDDESEGAKKKSKLSGDVGSMNKTVLQEQLLREEIKLKKMKEMVEQPTGKEALPETSMFSGENVTNAISNLTAQVQQSMQPGPISPSVATTTAGINISARLQQVLDATALPSNVTTTSKRMTHGAEMSAIAYHLSARKVAKKSLDKKLFATPYPKTYRQVWPIVPVSDGDFIKNFGLEAVCHYFDSKWQMDHLVKQRNASASTKPICHQCKCDFASAWQVRKSNSHSLLLCESCDFKNLKTLQREKIANHLKDLANIISQDTSDSSQSRAATNGSLDDLSDGGLRPKLPQRMNSKVSKYRVDPRPSDTLLQQSVRQPQQHKFSSHSSQGVSVAEVETQPESLKQQKIKKVEDKKGGKSSLKDKLDLISKQLLEKRLQESKVCTSNLLETTASPGTDYEVASNSTEIDPTNSPRVRNRKQVTPKAKRKASINDNSIDTCNE